MRQATDNLAARTPANNRTTSKAAEACYDLPTLSTPATTPQHPVLPQDHNENKTIASAIEAAIFVESSRSSSFNDKPRKDEDALARVQWPLYCAGHRSQFMAGKPSPGFSPLKTFGVLGWHPIPALHGIPKPETKP